MSFIIYTGRIGWYLEKKYNRGFKKKIVEL